MKAVGTPWMFLGTAQQKGKAAHEEEEEEEEGGPQPLSIHQHAWTEYLAHNHHITHSTIAGAGFRAFTQVDIPMGTCVGHYEGRLVDSMAISSMKSIEFVLHPKNDCMRRCEYVDASNPKHSNWLVGHGAPNNRSSTSCTSSPRW